MYRGQICNLEYPSQSSLFEWGPVRSKTTHFLRYMAQVAGVRIQFLHQSGRIVFHPERRSFQKGLFLSIALTSHVFTLFTPLFGDHILWCHKIILVAPLLHWWPLVRNPHHLPVTNCGGKFFADIHPVRLQIPPVVDDQNLAEPLGMRKMSTRGPPRLPWWKSWRHSSPILETPQDLDHFLQLPKLSMTCFFLKLQDNKC